MTLPKVPKRTTPKFGFAVLTRAVREGLSVRRFGKREVQAVVDFFGPGAAECAFCGSADVRRWDHLVPVGQGGDTVLGNMVLACGRCDDSKGMRLFDEWMVSSAPFSPTTRGIPDVAARIARLKQYSAHFGYVPVSPERQLTADEADRFAAIRAKRRELWKEIDDLIRMYQARLGTQASVAVREQPPN